MSETEEAVELIHARCNSDRRTGDIDGVELWLVDFAKEFLALQAQLSIASQQKSRP